MYQSSQGPAVMLELDHTAISTGAAYAQTTIPAAVTGSFSLVWQGRECSTIPRRTISRTIRAGGLERSSEPYGND